MTSKTENDPKLMRICWNFEHSSNDSQIGKKNSITPISFGLKTATLYLICHLGY